MTPGSKRLSQEGLRAASVQKPRRSKTFSGCWTCRSRHLKCDEARPTCLRCNNANIPCEGYSTRISWTSIKGPSSYRVFPRSGRNHRPQSPCASESGASPESAISEMPRESETRATIMAAASVQEESLVATSNARPSANTHLPLQPPCMLNLNDLVEHGSRRNLSLPSWPEEAEEETSPHAVASCAELEADLSRRHNVVGSDSVPLLFESEITDLSTPVTSTFWHVVQEPSMQLRRNVDYLPGMKAQVGLIEHWISVLSDTLIPIPGTQNPLRNILVPIAFTGVNAPEDGPSAATAVFHLICASSACHLSSSKEHAEARGQQLKALTLNHHNLGIRHLQRNIARSTDGEQLALLASLLMCMFYESITVPTSYWRIHLRGALMWLQKVPIEIWTQTEDAAILYQMFCAVATLIKSHVVFDQETSSFDSLLPSHDPFRDLQRSARPYLLEGIFGIPIASLRAIRKMSDMSVEGGKCPVGPYSGLSETKLDSFEFDLSLSMPKRPESSGQGGEKGMIYHYFMIYYFASWIYFKRVIRGCPLEQVQSLVGHALGHVEALASCTTRSFSPLLWPIAVTAFEATSITLQERVLVWLNGVARSSGLEVWRNLHAMARKLWQQRFGNIGVDIQWPNFLTDSANTSIMML